MEHGIHAELHHGALGAAEDIRGGPREDHHPVPIPIDEADIGGVDSNGARNDGAWDGCWQDDVGAWHEPGRMFPEEQSTDIQGLVDMKCH